MNQRQRRLARHARVLGAALVAFSLVAGLAIRAPVHFRPQSASAAFPGANGKIAFASDRDGSNEIYVMDADGGNQTRLTNQQGDGAGFPSWSPDGSRIVFVRVADIWVMDADGSNQTQLTHVGADGVGFPGWSPDGSRIVFGRRMGAGNTDIFVMNADGSDQAQLTNHPDFEGSPSWSPDGSEIAFYSDQDGNANIYVMNADGGNQTRLTSDPGDEHSPSWSPDGTRIAFVRAFDIYAMDADGSNQTNLTNSAGTGEYRPDWSPDGSRIVYQGFQGLQSGMGHEIFVMDADGSNQMSLTNHPSNDQSPAWQPLVGCALLIVPGIAGTYAADTEDDLGWLLNRGAHPTQMQVDPLGRVYDDLIETLENTGYVAGEDLFVVNYDWRLPPGPSDGVIDGHVSGLSGGTITDSAFEHSVDYFGHFLKAAVEAHEENNPDARLECVDVIAHSTGGLVTRGYIQSGAYQDTFMSANGERNLPRVNEFIMLGVPNRGASKPWNPLHDNWIIDDAYRVVLSKIVNRAWQKVLDGATIDGPDYTITLASIDDGQGNPDPRRFIRQYIATIPALLATYDFLDSGNGFEDVNSDPEWRNMLLLDLNDGFDLQATSDPSPFADDSAATVIYGTNLMTPTSVIQRTGAAGGEDAILPFSDYFANDAQPGETWFDDIQAPASGDGTVPIDSAAGQFFGDNRVTLAPFSAANTSGATDHTGIVTNPDVQTRILDTLGVAYEPDDIASGTGAANSTALSVTLDPVEGFVVDGNGKRLGYTTATGPLTEIPGSVWFGNTDGFGLVTEPLTLPLRLELSGLGEDHYVIVAFDQDGESGGVISQGFLEDGEVVSLPITDSGPEIIVPTGMTVDATSRHGAHVTYRASAIAGDGSVTPVTCAPASGSQFPIGTTTVTCSAVDADENESSASFEIHVRGLDEQLERLREDVVATAMSARTRHTLLRSLDATVAALDARQTTNACNNLLSFARDAQHNGDILLTMGARLALQADANRIRAVIGCQGA